MIGPILRRARKGNSRRIIMEARLPHFSHNPRPAPFSATPRNTNPIPGRFFVRLTACVIICEAYAFAPYLNGKNLVLFFVHSTTTVIVCGAYAVAPYTNTRKNGDFLLHRIKTNPKPDEFSSVRVGAYCIRPTSGHARGRMNLIPTQKSIPRTKRGHILTRFSIPRIKMNFKTPIFSFIRPLSWSFLGRMQYAPTRVPEKMAIFFCTG